MTSEPTDPDAAPDPIDAVIRSDHAAILRAAGELRAHADPAGTGDVFAALCADVVRHFVAEEQYLLPAVRRHLDGGDQIADEEFAEHQRVERELRRLDEDDDATDEWVATALTRLETDLRAHVQEQETRLLPALVAATTSAQRDEWGEGMLGAEQLAPTHPRVIAFRSATLSKVASWLTGLVDKGLDAR